MCGLAGYLGEGNKEILKRMTRVLTHRGPDDEGFYIEDNLGLGHRRLSIIDLKSGHQPMTNEDKTVWLIFNGEIYNFKILREKLLEKGHQFLTQSDTEVIIHLYEQIGDDFIKELDGMFALVLWDKNKKRLILARDRLGKKPLYYSFENQNLIFGSELKALLQYPSLKKEINLPSLAKYLVYEYVPAPHSIFKGIKKLGPGEYLVYQNRYLEIKKYWDIGFGQFLFKLDKENYLEELDKKLEQAVKKRLIADVPLGVFLSGGLDSTTIAYYAQKATSKKIDTFFIGFDDKSFDESKYAQQAADFLRTNHHQQILSAQDCLDLVPQIANFLDEPLADASIIPTYLLSKFCREKATVALSGDGGDELFMGYPTFQAHQLDQIYQKIPLLIRRYFLNPLINSLPVSFDNISFDFKLKKFISGANYIPEIKNQIWLGSFSPIELKSIFNPLIYRELETVDIFEDLEDYLKIIGSQNLKNRLIYLYFKNYLQDDILVKTDRAGMAASLEVRTPFLDWQLVEYVNSLPNEFKTKGWQTKYLLKELMKDRLPHEIVFRPKKGFGIPVAKWIKSDLKNFVLDIFSKSRIKKEGIFNYSYINQLLKEHFKSQKDNRKALWTLIVFELWLKKWFKSI